MRKFVHDMIHMTEGEKLTFLVVVDDRHRGRRINLLEDK